MCIYTIGYRIISHCIIINDIIVFLYGKKRTSPLNHRMDWNKKHSTYRTKNRSYLYLNSPYIIRLISSYKSVCLGIQIKMFENPFHEQFRRTCARWNESILHKALPDFLSDHRRSQVLILKRMVTHR